MLNRFTINARASAGEAESVYLIKKPERLKSPGDLRTLVTYDPLGLISM
jgi:hypothetical protein